MKNEEHYNTWIQSKRQIDISNNFADELMSRIYQYEHDKRKSLFDTQELIELISSHPFVKAGLVTAGAVTGLIRIIFVIYTFFFFFIKEK